MSGTEGTISRGVGIDVVRLTEGAAREAARGVGLGDEEAIYRGALEGFYQSLPEVNFRIANIFGEADPEWIDRVQAFKNQEMPDAISVDIGIHVVECLTACALGGRNAMSALVVAHEGTIRRIPDIYMDKIACAPEIRDVINFDDKPSDLLRAAADAKKSAVDELRVTILDRPRNRHWIDAARSVGSRVRLIADGDLAAAIATAIPNSGIDMLVGSGGAMEGWLAAAAMRGLGGGFQGRFLVKDDDDMRSLIDAGFDDPRKPINLDEVLPEKLIFSATGITSGDVLDSLSFRDGRANSHSLMVRTASETVRWIHSERLVARS